MITTTDRPSRRSEAEKAEVFAEYIDRTEPYFAKILEDGDRPWFGSDEERRAMFDQRFERPAPPAGMAPIVSVKAYSADDWELAG
jgi:hypothetical protein